MTIQLIFLARLRERFGVSREAYALTAGIDTVDALLAALRRRGGAFAEELAAGRCPQSARKPRVTRQNARATGPEKLIESSCFHSRKLKRASQL